jgi:S-formylglutathione hydrolase FrmB
MGVAFGRDTTGWWARDPARLAQLARAHGGPLPALWFDAGADDALVIDENRAFDWELTALGIAHEWHPRAGKHDWTYWRTNAPYSLEWLGRQVAR